MTLLQNMNQILFKKMADGGFEFDNPEFDYDDNENNNKNLFCARANVRPDRAMKHGNEIQAFAATGYSQNGGRFLTRFLRFCSI